MIARQKPPFTAIPDPPESVLHESRARFEAGQADLAQMAQEFGMALSTLKTRIARRWKWRAPTARKRGKPLVAKRRGRRGDARTRLNGSVRTVLKRELARLESEFASLPPDGDIERTTRVLASLVRTLVALARLDGVPARHSTQVAHAEPETPVDLARLRDDLARRLGAPDGPGEPAPDTGRSEPA